MIEVDQTAKEEVSKLMESDGYNPSKDFIRVGVKSGGCSGLSYELKFDNSTNYPFICSFPTCMNCCNYFFLVIIN